MSEDDYKAGLRGDPYSPTMDRQAYDAGESVRKTQEGIMGGGGGGAWPKSNLTAGPGVVIIVTSPILIFMYPAGGLVQVGPLLLMKVLTQALPQEPPFFVLLLLMIVTAGVAFIFAVKAERIISRFKVYRIFRHLFRMAALGACAFKFIIAAGNPAARQMSIPQTFNSASGGDIIFGLAVLVGMHFLFLRLDRGLFPVADPKTGLLDSELSDEERAEQRGKLGDRIRFVIANIVVLIILSGFMRGISILVPALASYALCWTVRWILQKRKHRQRLK